MSDIEKTEKILSEIDENDVAQELLQWLIDHVEEYIDNQESVFSVYFPVNSDVIKNMPVTNQLGNTYIEATEKATDKNSQKIVEKFTAKINSVKEAMSKDQERLAQLFQRMIWYYEMVGFHKTSGPIIQEMDGYIIVNKFDFELVGMDICVTKKYNKVTPDGKLLPSNKKPEILKQEHVPEGFSLEIEIKKWARVANASLL
jgi:hypothetical protein